MKWAGVLRAIRETVDTVPELVEIYGDQMTLAGASDHAVPRLDLLLVGDTETELWAPMTVQFSQFTVTMADLVASETVLRRLFHVALPVTFGGMDMWAQFLDGGDLTVPSRDGYFGRAVRFRLTPLRSLYEPSPYT